MRTSALVVAIVCSSQLIAAFPWSKQANIDQAEHDKPQATVTITVTRVIHSTDPPKKFVYVNQYGKVLSTVYDTSTKPTAVSTMRKHTSSSRESTPSTANSPTSDSTTNSEHSNNRVKLVTSSTGSKSESSANNNMKVVKPNRDSKIENSSNNNMKEVKPKPSTGSKSETNSDNNIKEVNPKPSTGSKSETSSDNNIKEVMPKPGTGSKSEISSDDKSSDQDGTQPGTQPGRPNALDPQPSSARKGSGFGFTYGPINPDGSCKVQAQVDQDMAAIPNEYGLVRTYGTDCNQTAMVLAAAKRHGFKLFAGISDITRLDSELAIIANAAALNGGWEFFDTVSIGNELVNAKKASASSVVSAILSAKKILRNKYHYPENKAIVTVDTLVATRDNPSLCDNSDYCAVNCHPFFDGGVTSSRSGDFVTTQMATLRAVLKNQQQEIVVTETGWPSQGSSNGAAVPSPLNQQDAITSIMKSFASTPAAVILFSAYNDRWKKNTAQTFGAEQWWGLMGNAPSNPR